MSVLVGGTEKVEHDLDRIECLQRHFHKEGVPVAHGSVPQPRQFERLQFASLIALGADESGFFIHIFSEIEAVSLVIVQAAHYVDRVEMRRCGKG